MNLCGKAYVIVDGDGLKHKNRKQRFFKDLGGRFNVLKVIEIENLLSNESIIGAIRSFPSCVNVDINKSKILNEKDYSEIRLGSYIENHLLKNEQIGKRKRFADTNSTFKNVTINCKLDFCLKALPNIKLRNMTTQSIRLTESILDFLIDNNFEQS